MSRIVMIVDDSASIRALLGLTLRQGGYRVVEAADGVEALEMLGTEPVDLVFCDLYMPRMDGLSLVREVKKNPGLSSIPMVMLTTASQGSEIREGRDAGVQAWIVKPFKPAQLLDVAARLITR